MTWPSMSWRCVPFADLFQIIVALVGEDVLAQFQHGRSLQARRASARGGGEDGIDDRLVAGAAADVARDRLDDLGAGRRGIAVEQRLRRHQHARRAVAALGRELLHEGALQRMQVGPVLHPVERLDRAAVHGFRQRQAGEMQFAVDQHAAGAATALAAAEFRRHVADQFAQRDQQIDAAVDEQGDVAAVVTKLERRSWS